MFTWVNLIWNHREGAAVFLFKRPRLTAEMFPDPAPHIQPSPTAGPEERGAQPSQQAGPSNETGKIYDWRESAKLTYLPSWNKNMNILHLNNLIWIFLVIR